MNQAEAAQIEADRKLQLARIMRASLSSNYPAKIAAHLKSFYGTSKQFPDNLEADAEIRTLPDGTILSLRLLKSSGNPAFDEVVMRAIERAGRLPKDDNGRMPDDTFVIKFRP